MKYIKLFENFEEPQEPQDMTGTAPVMDLISTMCNVPKAKAAEYVMANAMFDDYPFEELEPLDMAAVEEQIKDNEDCEFVLSPMLKDLLVYVNGLRMNVEIKGDPDEIVSKWEGMRNEFSK